MTDCFISIESTCVRASSYTDATNFKVKEGVDLSSITMWSSKEGSILLKSAKSLTERFFSPAVNILQIFLKKHGTYSVNSQ